MENQSLVDNMNWEIRMMYKYGIMDWVHKFICTEPNQIVNTDSLAA